MMGLANLSAGGVGRLRQERAEVGRGEAREGEFPRLAVIGLAKDQFSLTGPLDGDTTPSDKR